MTTILLMIGGFSLSAWGQTVEETRQKLSVIHEQIETYKVQIEEATQKEKASLNLINQYERQNKLLEELINTINRQIQTLNQQIEQSSRDIKKTEHDLKLLKKQYAIYLTNVYKQGKVGNLSLIFSAQNLNQGLIRMDYMRFFIEQQKRDYYNIFQKQKQLNLHQNRLKLQVGEQEKALDRKKKEESYLATQKNKLNTVVKQVKQNKSNLNKALAAQEKEQERLQLLIAKLIEAEELRRARRAQGMDSFKKSDIYNRNMEEFDKLNPDFALNKGKLFWPVENGVVITNYGKIYNQSLKTTKVSNGIDIAVPLKTPVSCIADGVIAKIDYIPGFENIIIIRHNKQYLTVYGQLSQVNVNEGDKVTAGQMIGLSGGQSSSRGPSIHFEVWKGKDHQDPKLWLAKQ